MKMGDLKTNLSQKNMGKRYVAIGLPLGAWKGGEGVVLIGGRRLRMPSAVYYVWTVLSSVVDSVRGVEKEVDALVEHGAVLILEEGKEWEALSPLRVIPQAYPAVSVEASLPPPLAVLTKINSGETKTLELVLSWWEYELYSEFDGISTLERALQRAKKRVEIDEGKAADFVLDLKKLNFILLDACPSG
jgi:hypothetical protein